MALLKGHFKQKFYSNLLSVATADHLHSLFSFHSCSESEYTSFFQIGTDFFTLFIHHSVAFIASSLWGDEIAMIILASLMGTFPNLKS